MDQRMQLMVSVQKDEASVAELCRQFGISRKTAYKWMLRYESEGPAGLVNRSRVPHGHPHQVSSETLQAILTARDAHPLWGPKKLLKILIGQGQAQDWPARSTVADLLKQHGRVFDRKKRHRVPPQTQPLAHADAPNVLWCCDFKGWFCTGDGQKCHPLTITDSFSRYLLRCQGLLQTHFEAVQPIFESAFREFGVPWAIRSDNGPPFASRAVGGLGRLSIWWIKLGIRPERIEPGHPQQNGRHERMHLTLQQATADPPASTFRLQQRGMDGFQQEYNELRPHEALGLETPASWYYASPRAFPSRLAEIQYPDGWQPRMVGCDGDFKWHCQPVFISEVLHGEMIGLEPLDERYWRAHFGPVFLGVFDTYRPQVLTGAALRRLDRQRVAEGLKPASPPPVASASAALRRTPPAEEKV
ncbi:MAG: IS481 family transposase [Acidobacteria bacterium]|nr:IS481 family transposase [Acidobacteriota bacterium]